MDCLTSEWIINNKEIHMEKKFILGKGQFGTVYGGEWRGLIVAIKKFDNLDKNKIKLMENEFNVMTKLHHPNIIQLLGYVENPFSIVMEYIPKGCLRNYLKKHLWTTVQLKMRFMMDIAKGLAYLHARKPSLIIHRDIKTTNFLVTKDLHVKIADFGICKILDNQYIAKSQENLQYLQDIDATANVGTLYYMAPELVVKKKTTNYNASVDIYSFGSVMYEVFEGNKLFDFISNREEYINVILSNERPEFFRTKKFIQKIILQCLDKNPLKRPTAIWILKYFQHYYKSKWWLKFVF
jgi:serine/threonine protein kinase